MTITVGNYTFEGPYNNTSQLKDNSGVYAVLCLKEDQYFLIDIGESATVKTRIESHDRAGCWKNNCAGTLFVSVQYTPNKQQAGRMLIEQELRNLLNPTCGER